MKHEYNFTKFKLKTFYRFGFPYYAIMGLHEDSEGLHWIVISETTDHDNKLATKIKETVREYFEEKL